MEVKVATRNDTTIPGAREHIKSSIAVEQICFKVGLFFLYSSQAFFFRLSEITFHK